MVVSNNWARVLFFPLNGGLMERQWQQDVWLPDNFLGKCHVLKNSIDEKCHICCREFSLPWFHGQAGKKESAQSSSRTRNK